MENSISIVKKGNKAVIVLGNDLTIYQAVTIKDALQDALETNQELEVRIEEVEQMDLTIIQLLLSLEKTAKHQKKKVEIKWHSSSKFATVLKKSGFSVV